MKSHAAFLAALALVCILSTVPSAAQGPVLITENLPTTATMDPTGPPSQAIRLDCNGGFEFGQGCWEGWLDPGWGPQDRQNVSPYEGAWHLRQGWTDGVVRLYQAIDLSVCDPEQPVWVRRALHIMSDKPLEGGPFDMTYTVIWSTQWLTLALVSENDDRDRGDSYADNWYRVEGLGAVATGIVYLSFETAFTYDGFPHWTTVDVDGAEFWCLPRGWDGPPHRVFVTVVMNGVGQ